MKDKTPIAKLFLLIAIILGTLIPNISPIIIGNIDLEEDENLQMENPYKTQSRIEEEDEFDSPELLDKEVQQPNIKYPDSNPNQHQGKFDFPYIEPSEEWRLYIFSIYEVLMIVFLVGFIINCINGKSANENMSKKWFIANSQFFQYNYAHIGTGTEYNIETPVLQESYNNFKFYASGRRNINWMQVSLDFQKRQDLISVITSVFLPGDKDRFIYDGCLAVTSVPYVMVLCRKKDIKYMKKTYSDLDFMTSTYEAPFISNNLLLSTEDPDIANKLFEDRNLMVLYEIIEEFIDIIYITDRQSYSRSQHAVYFSFNPTRNMKVKTMLAISQFVHLFCDKLCNIEFNSIKRKQCDKIRTEYEDFKTKVQLDKSKKEEDIDAVKKSEKQTSVKKNLTKEQAIRLEEKEKKDKMKKQRSKNIKVMNK